MTNTQKKSTIYTINKNELRQLADTGELFLENIKHNGKINRTTIIRVRK